jgi:UDP-N-acetylglucosamine/UDP-N-acetylgalactosamine diphosphorylase
MTETIEQLRERFEAAGQGHLFAYWDELGSDDRDSLLKDINEIDLTEVEELTRTLLKADGGHSLDLEGLEPAPYIAHPAKGGETAPWEAAKADGLAALSAGKVAAFTVAGGQGTRLGYDGPKGTFPVTPVQAKPLFAVFAEKILAAQKRSGAVIPWYIMTSTLNHEATVKAFTEAAYFGLSESQVTFFSQGRMPAVDYEGKIFLAGKGTVAMTPDGHGGALRALVRSGAIASMKAAGIEAISYFQVDNPLVQVIDPAFIGFHLRAGSEMSSKMIPKAYAGEKVGHFCLQKGKTLVVEYSDMPADLQEQTDASGQLRYLAGSIAIHVLSVDFVERIGGGQVASAQLPFHRADKKIASLDAAGNVFKPEAPNGVKFEMFVFDALPFAANPVIIETLREDDFSPVKNAEGVDSPESCRADQLRQWVRWLRAAGEEVETDATGLPSFSFEVSPLFADSCEAFVEKWQGLETKPALVDGLVLEA